MADINYERQYWLWVTKSQYYLDANGSDREWLEPEIQNDAGEWWTCNKNTKKGDLIFLWRTFPKCDIRYLIQAKSDAYCIPISDKYRWRWPS